MVKATLRSAVLLGIAAVAVLTASMPSFAEVQNVKVGGDVTVRAFHRDNLDLTDGPSPDAAADTTLLDGEDDFIQSTVGVNIGADLTENVSTFIRLANERDWDNDAGCDNGDGDFELSQAYITLKELFYSPLTLRVGTQPIVWGRGFVLGSALIPSVLGSADDRNAAITANEFTEFTAFDAIRATLDLSQMTGDFPVSADYVYIKLDENTSGTPDDVNLQGVNFSTKLDAANTELEAYFLHKRDESGATANINKTGNVSTIGVRGSAMPSEGLSTWAEAAYQFGRRASDAAAGTTVAAPLGSPFQAWAFNLGAEYGFADMAMGPKVGAEWIFWSGKDSDGGIAGWDPIARSYFTTAIREFQTATAGGFYGTDQPGDTSAATNQNQISIWGGLSPVEDLTATSRLSLFWQNVGALPTSAVTGVRVDGKRKGFAGTEWDNQLVYDYTDDVQLGLLYGVFFPGSIYSGDFDSTAQELVSTVSVKF
jgi:hypothetical protein